MTERPDIVLVRDRISPEQLVRLVELHFQDMVKLVVDLERGVVAVGGELHADGRGQEDCIEFTAPINIRPSRGNRTMTLQDPARRERLRALVFERIGRGEPLP